MPKAFAITDDMVDAVILSESNGKPDAVGDRKGANFRAAGLGQLWGIAWKDVQAKRPELKSYDYDKFKFNPNVNRQFTKAYLEIVASGLPADKKDFRTVVAGYKLGPTALRKSGFDLSKTPGLSEKVSRAEGFLSKRQMPDKRVF